MTIKIREVMVATPCQPKPRWIAATAWVEERYDKRVSLGSARRLMREAYSDDLIPWQEAKRVSVVR